MKLFFIKLLYRCGLCTRSLIRHMMNDAFQTGAIYGAKWQAGEPVTPKQALRILELHEQGLYEPKSDKIVSLHEWKMKQL